MKKTEADFQQMIQERLKKVEEIKNCLKISTVSPKGNATVNIRFFVSVAQDQRERGIFLD